MKLSLKQLRKNAVGRMIDGRLFVVLYVDANGKTDPCPFCGRVHFHGQGFGNRVARCLVPGSISFLNDKGELFSKAVGYVLEMKQQDTP